MWKIIIVLAIKIVTYCQSQKKLNVSLDILWKKNDVTLNDNNQVSKLYIIIYKICVLS